MSRKPRASQIEPDTSNFDNILSPLDDDVQKALDTINDHVQSVNLGGTGILVYETGDVIYADGYNSLTRLPIGNTNYVLKSNGATPYWSSNEREVTDIIKVGKIDAITPASTLYLLPDFSESSNEDFKAYLIDGYGEIGNLDIYTRTPPGGGEDIVFTVRINGADTAITVTLSGANTTASSSNVASVSAGDRITIRAVTSAGCSADDVYVSLRYYENTVDNVIDIITGGKVGILTAGAIRYLLPNFSESATETFPLYVAPEDGYIDNLKIYSNVAPGGVEAVGFTVRIGGVNTILTAVLSGAANTVEDITHIVAIYAGEIVTLQANSTPGSAAADIFVIIRYRS